MVAETLNFVVVERGGFDVGSGHPHDHLAYKLFEELGGDDGDVLDENDCGDVLDEVLKYDENTVPCRLNRLFGHL